MLSPVPTEHSDSSSHLIDSSLNDMDSCTLALRDPLHGSVTVVCFLSENCISYLQFIL